ncbi:MAG: DUF3810 domain-containing protein [Lachnospiraceae bacterium]|nr:DUF3810 domain-containing protein [Candidatus Colinaster equi]
MKRRFGGIVAGLLGVTVILNIIAWNSGTFCDWYVENIFPIWGQTYGRLTTMSSRSVGEIMIALAVVLIAIAIVLGLVAVIFALVAKYRGQKSRFTNFVKIYSMSISAIASLVILIMTLNCYILYHCSTFEEKYLEDYLISKDTYSVEELGQLRDYVVTKANEYCRQVDRDENGLIVYDKDIAAEAIKAMQSLGAQYPQLSGYYTTPKPFAASEFFSQQYMKGYYFPFSMEANYNDVMYIASKPATMCHELAHTKGFIYEDEANMIAFLACVHSDDPLFRYSGYLSVLNYIDNDYKASIDNDVKIYSQHPKIKTRVKLDNVFLTADAWEKVEKKAVVKTSTVKKVSETFVDTNLKVNGIEQGDANYCEVVGLLMDFYVCGIDDEVNRDIYLASLSKD